MQDGSAQFEKRAASLKNKFWLENLKSMIAMGVIGLILAGLLYWKFFSPSGGQQPMYMGQPPPAMMPPPPPPPSGGGSSDASSGGPDSGE